MKGKERYITFVYISNIQREKKVSINFSRPQYLAFHSSLLVVNSMNMHEGTFS